MNPDTLKHCPICTNDLPVGEFGICRARKDGRNLYCKSCIRQKVTQSRRALKEYKSARKRAEQNRYWHPLNPPEPTPTPMLVKSANKTPVERVREAIQAGQQTHREIRRYTKLDKDTLCDALTIMLLWDHEIRTELKGDTRIYFIPEEPKIEVQRKQVVLSGFSGIQAIMPERKRA